MSNCHVVDRYFEAVSHLGIKNDGHGLDYFIPEKDQVEMNWLPKSHQNGFVAYVIGTTGWTIILPFRKMGWLCDKINKPFILLGAKEEFEAGEKLEKSFNADSGSKEIDKGFEKLGKKTVIFNACGKFYLSQSASLVKQIQVVFGHDTGLTHIAAAFKKIIFSNWGGRYWFWC